MRDCGAADARPQVIDIDRHSTRAEYQVRATPDTREGRLVDPKSQAESLDFRPEGNLDVGITPPYCLHTPAGFFGRR